jgi:hypothetical protein
MAYGEKAFGGEEFDMFEVDFIAPEHHVATTVHE